MKEAANNINRCCQSTLLRLVIKLTSTIALMHRSFKSTHALAKACMQEPYLDENGYTV